MLRFLFPGLTADPERGAPSFDAITQEARQPHWYVAGGVPDELDGRFAVLATLTALATVRLDQLGQQRESIALTERFIQVMESEHRELGLGDPALGRTVRRLVAALGRRVEQWRAAVDGGDWDTATRESLYKDEAAPGAIAHAAGALKDYWARLSAADGAAVSQGRFA